MAKKNQVLINLQNEKLEIENKIKELEKQNAIKDVTGLSKATDDLKERIESFYACDVEKKVKIDGDKDTTELKRHIKTFSTELIKLTYGPTYVASKVKFVNGNSDARKEYGEFDANKLHEILHEEDITEEAGNWITMKDIRSKLFGNSDIQIQQKHLPLHKVYDCQFVSNGEKGTAVKVSAK